MKVPLLDLKAQYAAIREPVKAAFSTARVTSIFMREPTP